MSNPAELSNPAHGALPVSSGQASAALSALDLLALAGRSAARVAQEQSGELEIAAQLLERAAIQRTTVWIAGDAAFEHARRMQGAGHRALAIADPSRLPSAVNAGDLLLLISVADVPCGLLAAARQRQVDAIVLAGPERRELEVGAAIFVECRDERARELTHTFILTALYSQSVDRDEAESAA